MMAYHVVECPSLLGKRPIEPATVRCATIALLVNPVKSIDEHLLLRAAQLRVLASTRGPLTLETRVIACAHTATTVNQDLAMPCDQVLLPVAW